MLTVFFSLSCDRLAIFVESLFKQVMLNIQLLLPCYVHGINAQIYENKITNMSITPAHRENN